MSREQLSTGAAKDEAKRHRPWHTREAALWSGMSERQLLQLAREGIIPGKKIGGVWFFSPTRLAEFFDVDA